MRNAAYSDKRQTLPYDLGTRRCDAVRDQRRLCCNHTALPFGRPARGELNIHGRSPDSWVTARPILPRLASSGDHRVCSPLTVAGAVTELAAFDRYRTVFPFSSQIGASLSENHERSNAVICAVGQESFTIIRIKNVSLRLGAQLLRTARTPL